MSTRLDTAEEDDRHARLVAHELRTLRAREEARRILAVERAGPLPPFDAGTLGEILARPPQPAARVAGLIPWQASTLLTAQRKTGKTTAVLNLADALITGTHYLDRFPVRPIHPDRKVAVLNYEVSADTFAHWAHDVGIPHGRLLVVNLRGRSNPLADAGDRRRLAELLRSHQTETVITDPFGRAYSGASQNDAGEVGAWLAQLDQWARGDVGASDVILTAHAGWNGERTRGSTALEDWADSIITLTRDENEGGDGARYLRAIGRDVEVEEDRLGFDPATRRLTLTGSGSRRAATTGRRHAQLDGAVLATIQAAPGLNTSELGRRLKADGVGFQRGDVGHAAKRLEQAGRLRSEAGSRGSICYFEATYPDVSRRTPPGHLSPIPTPPIGRG